MVTERVNQNPEIVKPPLEIPRDKRGRVRWKILKQNPQQLMVFIEAQAQSFIDAGNFLSSSRLKATGMSWFDRGVSQNYPGGITTLRMRINGDIKPQHALSVGEDNLPRDRRGRVFWSRLANDEERLRQILEDEARTHLVKWGTLTQKSLSEVGQTGLNHAIQLYYPDGLSGLKTKVEVANNQKPKGFWRNPENIRFAAQIFLKQHQQLSVDALRQFGCTSLENAIPNYPGGWTQLRIDLGLKELRKSSGYWTPDTIKAETRKFYESHGLLSRRALIASGRSDLNGQITHYLGGMAQLKRDLGIPLMRKDNYWTDETIEREAHDFYRITGTFSTKSLIKVGKNDLLLAIRRHYRGGLTVLKQKLGITAQEPNISPEQANEMLRRLLEE